MKGDKYKNDLFGIISDTHTAIKEKELERVRINLEILSTQLRLMPHEGFMGGRSIFAVISLMYKALKIKYDELIAEPEKRKYNERLNDEYLFGLA